MAGKRMIHDNVCESRKVNKISFEAEALWFRIQLRADDNGNYYRDCRRVFANCMLEKSGATEVLVEAWIRELVEVGLLVEYEADERKYVHVADFHKYQSFRQDRPVTVDYPVHPESAESLGYHKTGIAQEVRRADNSQPTDNHCAAEGWLKGEVEVKGKGEGKGFCQPSRGDYEAFRKRFSTITGVTLSNAKQVRLEIETHLAKHGFDTSIAVAEEFARQRGRDRIRDKPQFAWKNYREDFDATLAGLNAPKPKNTFPKHAVPDR